MWTDSHCHLQDLYFDSVAGAVEQIEAARVEGVERFVCIGTGEGSSRAALSLACDRPDVWASIGLHPHDAHQGVEGIAGLLGSLTYEARPRVVAVGECGLDYHYDHSPRPVQRTAFAEQIALAKEHELALVVHTREAWDDTLSILGVEGVPERTVIHCFTGGPGEAKRCLDLGAWISFSGIVTFGNAEEVREAAAVCPLERLLVETDAPFLAPVPHRGKTNQPAFVPLVGAAVAAAKGLDVAVVEEATWLNAGTVFRIGDP